MKTRSAKAKGKTLEKLVRARLIEAFNLDEEDIRVPVGSETGADIKLNSRAKRHAPFSIECKNRETFLSIYNFYAQAEAHSAKDGLVPLLVIKMNRHEPLAIINLDHFLTLLTTFNE